MSLYDDPPWAQSSPRAVLDSASIRRELDLVDVVKCPRMAGYLDQVIATFPSVSVVWMHRDLRDILASIQERVRSAPNTTLLRFAEIGIVDEGVRALCLASKIYREVLDLCLSRSPSAVTMVKYEDFFVEKEETIARVAERLNMPHDLSKIRTSLNVQLGPARHKFEGIRGPARYLTDLTSDDLDRLIEAAEPWNAIATRVNVRS